MHGYIAPQGPWCAMFKESATGSETERISDDDKQSGFVESGFRVYPNPTGGIFTVELSADADNAPATIQCYNMTGSLILQKEIISGRRLEMNIAGREPGIYFVRVTADKWSDYRKIIKTN